MILVFLVRFAADPRFKLLPFASERAHRRATDATVSLMEHVYESTSNKSEPSQSASWTSVNASPTLQTVASSSCSPADVGPTSDASSFIPTLMFLHQQLVAYASEPVIPDTKCPLTWWADNRHKYPALSEVARRLLVIPAAAVSTERLFTKKGEEVVDKRDAVSPERAEQVLFIMENL